MAMVKYRNSVNPWKDFERLRDEINDLFNVGLDSEPRGLFERHVSPALDLTEEADHFKVMCELPGIEQKDIDITITGKVLTIKGERKGENRNEGEKVFKKESWTGSFQRTISLPQTVDPDRNIDAVLANGILTLTLPKKEEAKPKQITVKVE